jgi:predicted Zn-dependent peptidase
MTGFALKVADKSLSRALDLLSDILANPRFDQTDLDREQKVILEEMKMVEDTPDELLGELFNAAYFPGHSLGRPIEGTEETVSSFDQNTLTSFHALEFSPANLVVAAAGNVEHQELVDLVANCFQGSATKTNHTQQQSPTPAAPILIEQKKELEQAHLVIATPWPGRKRRQSLCRQPLGVGNGRRHFKPALANGARRARARIFGGSGRQHVFRCGRVHDLRRHVAEHLDEVLDISLDEMRRVVNESVPEDELKLAKEQALSSILLSLESSSARVSALARQEIIHGRRISPQEIIEKMDAVTADDMQRVAQEYFHSEKIALGALGNLNGFNVDRSRLRI